MAVQLPQNRPCSQQPSQVACFQRFARAAAAEADAAMLNGHVETKGSIADGGDFSMRLCERREIGRASCRERVYLEV